VLTRPAQASSFYHLSVVNLQSVVRKKRLRRIADAEMSPRMGG
jgi:hypothetical protein